MVGRAHLQMHFLCVIFRMTHIKFGTKSSVLIGNVVWRESLTRLLVLHCFVTVASRNPCVQLSQRNAAHRLTSCHGSWKVFKLFILYRKVEPIEIITRFHSRVVYLSCHILYSLYFSVVLWVPRPSNHFKTEITSYFLGKYQERRWETRRVLRIVYTDHKIVNLIFLAN